LLLTDLVVIVNMCGKQWILFINALKSNTEHQQYYGCVYHNSVWKMYS